ncbi:MADS-box protein AGL42-like [Gastrolobium bilobum]|uniref:MADS-box protein AGL42-like n=1 Tax=Gastrolobium bilobum TaxID=150636 RepID=UPI002AB147FB|nr:MADS-box protein AGL42-like [Gastrolobium bilobum]
MVRGKIQMKRIEKEESRQVTFSKRKNGLLKKAHELSVLCEAQIAVIIFSQKGRLYEFSSSDMKKILERYREYVKDVPANKFEEDFIQKLVFESSSMAKKIELLEHSQRMLLGHGLNSCSLDELQGIEDQLDRSLQKIRQRKGQLFREHIEQLQNKERDILGENAKLSEMCGEKSWRQQWVKPTEAAPHSPSSHSSHVVDTELFIGLPEQRC